MPKIPGAEAFIAQGCVPGGTHRNWDSYGHKVHLQQEDQRLILADPQTSGGLLVAVEPGFEAEFQKQCQTLGLELTSIGTMTAKSGPVVQIV